MVSTERSRLEAAINDTLLAVVRFMNTLSTARHSALAFAVLVATVHAQAPLVMSFDVASIRRNTSVDGRCAAQTS